MNKFQPCLESLDQRITPSTLDGPQALDPLTGLPLVQSTTVVSGVDNGGLPYAGYAITVAGTAAFVVNLNNMNPS